MSSAGLTRFELLVTIVALGGIFGLICSEGLHTVVIRVDGSGGFEKVRLSDYRVYGTVGIGNRQQDLFASAPGWLAPDQVPLNSASGPEGLR
jgi:hypothetical protein